MFWYSVVANWDRPSVDVSSRQYRIAISTAMIEVFAKDVNTYRNCHTEIEKQKAALFRADPMLFYVQCVKNRIIYF